MAHPLYIHTYIHTVAYNFQTGNNKVKLKKFITYRIDVTDFRVKLFELHIHILQAVLFYFAPFEIYRPRKPRQ
jgi:hypothetical protein